MSKSPKIVYQKRAFLNDDKSMAGFILAYLEEFETYSDAEEGDEYAQVHSYPCLDIGDCSNRVSLDFSFHGAKSMKVALKKLRLFREVVDGITNAFEKEVEKFEALQKTLPKKRKTRKKREVEIVKA